MADTKPTANPSTTTLEIWKQAYPIVSAIEKAILPLLTVDFSFFFVFSIILSLIFKLFSLIRFLPLHLIFESRGSRIFRLNPPLFSIFKTVVSGCVKGFK